MRAAAAAAIAVVLAAGPGLAQTDAETLRGPDAFTGIADDRTRATALFEEMGKVLTHPRCVNCHPRTERPLQGDAMMPHQPPVVRGDGGMGVAGMRCGACHGAENVAFLGAEGGIPGHPHWHLAPASMAWDGKTLGEICAQIKDPERNGGKTLAELHEHMAEDGLVGWGWDPGPGRTAPPGDQETLGALTQAWIDAGAHCPAS
ncbi:MAG: Isoquinoline 1-oxidoreductase subunit [Inquilinaceae bacterium]